MRLLSTLVLVLVFPGHSAAQWRVAAFAPGPGVEIVNNAEPSWGPGERWRIVEDPVLEIGVVEGEESYVFGEVVGTVRQSDGTIVVADEQLHQLRFFGANGEFIRSVGGFGAGPGEFQGIEWVDRCHGDSLFVYDYVNHRMTVFDDEGALGRTFVVETPVPGRSPAEMSCTRSGDFLVDTRSVDAVRRQVGPHRLTAPIALTDLRGEVAVDFGEFPGPDRYRYERSDGPLPLGKRVAHAISAEYAFIGTGDYQEIGVFSHDGTLRKIIRWNGADLTITPEDLERYRRLRLEGVESPRRRAALERRLRGMEFPEAFPAFSRFMLDSEGNLWAETYARPGDETSRWVVFDPDGTWLGTVAFPERFSPYQIDDDLILGQWENSLGVNFVRAYRLDKPTR